MEILTLVAILVGGSMWMEWKLLHSTIPFFSAAIRWFYTDTTRALVGSVGVSVLIGSLFGAAGLICALAGVASSVLIQPVWAAERSGAFDELHHLVADTRTALSDRRDVLRRRAAQLVTIVKVLVAPIVICCKVLGWLADRTPGLKENG